MKRLVLAAAILCALLGGTFWNTQRLNGLTAGMAELVEQAGAAASAGRWDQAADSLDRASRLWADNSAYLHVTLRHADIDAVTLALAQLDRHLQARDLGQWEPGAAALSVQLSLLSEAEALTLKNVF